MNDKEMLERWKRELDEQIDLLRSNYNRWDDSIKSIRRKISIADTAFFVKGFSEEDFAIDYLDELNTKLETSKRERDKAEEDFNSKVRYLKAISDEIDSVMSTL